MNSRIKVTPTNITDLRPWEIFVFGSNLAGKHGGGAALTALKRFGAIMGHSVGFQGQSYALPTKDVNLRTLPISEIRSHVALLRVTATKNEDEIFLITAVGCGLAGYTPSDIAPLFRDFLNLPNVSLPSEFIAILQPSEL